MCIHKRVDLLLAYGPNLFSITLMESNILYSIINFVYYNSITISTTSRLGLKLQDQSNLFRFHLFNIQKLNWKFQVVVENLM